MYGRTGADELDVEQRRILNFVHEKVSDVCTSPISNHLVPMNGSDVFIKCLEDNCSPGQDGLTTEHIRKQQRFTAVLILVIFVYSILRELFRPFFL